MPPIRKRMKRRESPTGVRFITFSCYHRRKLLGNPDIRTAFAAAILEAREHCGFALIAWVIMPEHIHLMMLPRDPEWPTERILFHLKGPFAEMVIGRWRNLGPRGRALVSSLTTKSGRVHFWQVGGGFDRGVRDVHELNREVNYIHANPVERELCRLETEWPWSSSREYARIRDLAASHPPQSLAALPDRAAIPIDTVRVDRHDFPEQCLATLYIDGRPCWTPGQS